MIGTWVNVGLILLGGLLGLTLRNDLSPVRQRNLRILLGASTIILGLHTIWRALPSSPLHGLAWFCVALLALMLARYLDGWLRLQKASNHAGQYAKARIAPSPSAPGPRFGNSFLGASILFCLAPLSMVGPIQEGLASDLRLLVVKGIMDGMTSFTLARQRQSGVLLSALPVLAWQGTWTLLARGVESGFTATPILLVLQITNGLLACMVALVILELRRIPLAAYYPAVLIAPLLAWMLR